MGQERYPIAICMAGAVSAGAYSAGAMSVLLDAIRRWEDDTLDLPSRPKHRIQIKGMSGASAGSVQAALSSLDIFSDNATQELGREAWFSVSMQTLLSTDDLDDLGQDSNIKSALNSKQFKVLTDRILKQHSPSSSWPQYVSDDYEIRLSVTNLRGVPYNISLPEVNPTEFGMSRHNEYLHYRFIPNGSPDSIRSAPVFYVESGSDSDLKDLGNGALASSAFPLAFEPIKVIRPTLPNRQDIHDQQAWLNPKKVQQQGTQTQATYQERQCIPDWNSTYGVKEAFYAVDGGATNNEPLLEAFKLLFGEKLSDWGNLSEVSEHGDGKDGRVLLIDPFPNSLDQEIKDNAMRLDKILGMLKSTLIRHARFSEPIMVSSNLKERVGLVYPSNPLREPDNNKQLPEERKMLAIKSGALAGFAGFLKRNFLEHDYQLGKLNMQRFLRYYFTFPLDHPHVKNDHEYLSAWSFDDPTRGEKRVPIIPVYIETGEQFEIFNVNDSERDDFYRNGLKDYKEKFTQQDSKELTKGLTKRLGAAVEELMKAHKVGKLVMWGWKLVGKKTLAKKIVQTVETSLSAQDLLDEN